MNIVFDLLSTNQVGSPNMKKVLEVFIVVLSNKTIPQNWSFVNKNRFRAYLEV